jgi:RNA polymerase sigma-70 factor (ECF subfamily)
LTWFSAEAHLERVNVRSASPPKPTLRLVPPRTSASGLDDLYRRYCRYVAAVVLRLDGRTSEVDDLVQEVFLQAARGIQGLRDPEAVKGWLATITVRVVRQQLRRRRLRRMFGLDAAIDYTDMTDPAASPLDRLMVRTIYRILDEVAVADRIAFTLHHMEGEKLEEVARLCDCSCSTAKRRIARALQAIEDRMADPRDPKENPRRNA